MKKVLLTGASGQLGSELKKTLPDEIRLFNFEREALDICDSRAVRDIMFRVKPAVVINAAAFTGVDQAEAEPAVAETVNATAPGHLAEVCRDTGAWFLHLSTDFVFDGLSDIPYQPESKPAPLGVYGQTKLRGEENVLRELPSALIVRTSWVYSAYGSNFVKTMLRLLATRETVDVVQDQIGGPTWARGLARMLWSAVNKNNLYGIYHWSDDGECSWYDFARAIAEEAIKVGLIKRCAEVRPILSRDYDTLAIRPAYSVLDHSSSKDIGVHPLPWKKALQAMLKDYKEGSDD